MIIDAKGLGCPQPVILAEEALARLEEGTVEVLVDNEASVGNLSRFAAKNGFYFEKLEEGKAWRVRIVKGYVCEVPGPRSEAEKASGRKDLMVIIASDVMGKEETLGRVLMKGYLETLRVTKELPHTMFFLNAAVKLTTVDAEAAAIIKDLADLGVEVFSCGTCLKHYSLEGELKVGYRGTTNHIVEGMKEFDRTVWIG